MCEPVSTTTMFYSALALTAASAGMQYMGAQAQADAQGKYQQAQAEENARYMAENAKQATDAYIDKAAQENLRMAQEGEAASQEIQQMQTERIQKAGRAMATSETAGLSFDLLMNDFMRQDAQYRNNVRRQLEMDYDQAQMNVKGFRAEAQGRINSVRPYIPDPISRPSFLGAGLQIAGGAVDAYTRYATKVDGKYRLGS